MSVPVFITCIFVLLEDQHNVYCMLHLHVHVHNVSEISRLTISSWTELYKEFVIEQLSRYFGTIEEIKCFKAPSTASDKALAYTFPVYSLHNTRSIQ